MRCLHGDLARLQRLEQQVKRHHLGQRGGMAFGRLVAGVEHLAGGAVHDQGGVLVGIGGAWRAWARCDGPPACGFGEGRRPVVARGGVRPETPAPAASRTIPRQKERFCHASQSHNPQNRTTPVAPKDQIAASLARKNDESALFYGCLGCKMRLMPRRHKKFAAAQQISLDDPNTQAHIGHVAVQQAAGHPGVPDMNSTERYET